ncbi:unnamed protein product [Rotaria magnacalcarata]
MQFRLMLICCFRYGVLDCFKLYQVVSIMEITGGFDFNLVLSAAVSSNKVFKVNTECGELQMLFAEYLMHEKYQYKYKKKVKLIHIINNEKEILTFESN